MAENPLNRSNKVYLYMKSWSGQTLCGYFHPHKLARLVKHFFRSEPAKCDACGGNHDNAECPELKTIMERHLPNASAPAVEAAPCDPAHGDANKPEIL